MSCSSPAMMRQEAPFHLGDDYVTLTYGENETSLSSVDRRKLKELIVNNAGAKVKEIRIMVWPDQEYDPHVMNVRNVTLANDRAWHIKDFIIRHWSDSGKIVTYNMAYGPRKFDQFFQTEQYEVKSSFEKSEVTATVLPDGRVSYTKGSKAMVIIERDEKI